MVFEHLEGPAYRVSHDAHALMWGLAISADILALSGHDFERQSLMPSRWTAEVRP